MPPAFTSDVLPEQQAAARPPTSHTSRTDRDDTALVRSTLRHRGRDSGPVKGLPRSLPLSTTVSRCPSASGLGCVRRLANVPAACADRQDGEDRRRRHRRHRRRPANANA
ncbi:hypothetical protein CERSUDRAFT_101506 [Gelatoporia subvermispora B]|uniref:Uncharacterized protein n=1 Tax=Ceriporiopsis subvermispora (strain B) TaxID=914234 RepID=M2Q0G0_CERS8|nr:hypothetical protein CERSUDRAFT_101506 [Gelatoporia subvermispora B]